MTRLALIIRVQHCCSLPPAFEKSDVEGCNRLQTMLRSVLFCALLLLCLLAVVRANTIETDILAFVKALSFADLKQLKKVAHSSRSRFYPIIVNHFRSPAMANSTSKSVWTPKTVLLCILWPCDFSNWRPPHLCQSYGTSGFGPAPNSRPGS